MQPPPDDMPAPSRWKIKSRFVDPVLNLLRQGITPEKLALSLSLGLVVGVFPLIGSTTFICTACAILFRLNLPAIQLANYAVFSLQVVLLLPLIFLGTTMFGVALPPFSVAELKIMFADDWWGTMAACWQALLCAMGAWTILAVPVGWGLYSILRTLLRRFTAGAVSAKTS